MSNTQSRSEQRYFVVPNNSNPVELTFTRIIRSRANLWEEAHVYSFHRESGRTPADIIIKPEKNTPWIQQPGRTPVRTAGQALLLAAGLAPEPITLRSKDIARLPDAVQKAIASMRD